MADEQFKAVGLSELVEYLLVDRHTTNCEQGIYESHLICYEKGLKAGANTILIFEDDVIIDRFQVELLNKGIAFIKQRPDWKMLFLGCMTKASRPTDSSAVREVDYQCLTHAYAIHRPFARQLVEKPWQGVPFDVMLSRFTGGMYAYYPSFAFQSNASTDNINHPRLDTFRRWCGGLQRIQKVNEWYQRYKLLLIGGHLVGLAILAWLLYLSYSQ